MAKTVMQMVAEAQAAVPGVGPEEARRRHQDDPNADDCRRAGRRQSPGVGEIMQRATSGPERGAMKHVERC